MPPQSTSTVTSPAPPPQHRSSTSLIVIAIVFLLAILVGGYFVWVTEAWRDFVPSSAQEPVPPQQTETSDIEADLQSVEFGSQGEIEDLEAQI